MINDTHSEKLDTIWAQLSRQRARGQKDLIITPGNYGEGFLADKLNLDLGNLVRCGDFINETIDMAGEFGTNSLLLAARVGKMLQLGNGIAGRYEWQEDDGIAMLSDCVLRAGGDAAISQRILYCDRLDDVVEVLWMTAFLHPVMVQLMQRVDKALKNHALPGMQIEAIAFSNRYGMLGKTPGAEELLMLHRKLL